MIIIIISPSQILEKDRFSSFFYFMTSFLPVFTSDNSSIETSCRLIIERIISSPIFKSRHVNVLMVSDQIFRVSKDINRQTEQLTI